MIPALRDGGVALLDMALYCPSPPNIFVSHDGIGFVAKRFKSTPMSDPPHVHIIAENQQHSTYDGTPDTA